MTDILFSSPGIFFALGIILSSCNKQIHIPKQLIRILSLYLILSIGLKGGQELQHISGLQACYNISAALLIGFLHSIILFYSLKYFTKLTLEDIASFAAHYASVSVGTFMIAVTFLKLNNIPFESNLYLFLVAMECPAILASLGLFQLHTSNHSINLRNILKKVFHHETIIALLFGLAIGALANEAFLFNLKPFYVDLFVGALTFFMLSMGIEAGQSWKQIQSIGNKLILMAIVSQALGSLIGLIAGLLLGFSTGGITLLMILTSSASYIAAPCVMRESIPNANNSAMFLISLGITFPLNVLFGVRTYLYLAQMFI